MDNLDPYNFLFQLPLYSKIKITSDNKDAFVDLTNFKGDLDAYNPTLKEKTTYKVVQYPASGHFGSFEFHSWSRHGGYVLECKRTSERIMIYVFWNFEESTFQKIGQYPSIADLHISKIKTYNKVLNKEQLKEFTRAIGLAANGVGIGSFVYLRRIFENLIEEAYQKAKSDHPSLTEEDYHKLRMAEKIDFLKSYLPVFLSENKSLYSILSIGLHSLTEDDCLQHFEIVKVGIELILDEKVEKQQKEAKIEEAKKKLAELNNTLSKKS
ncbi:hypothetical protein [Spirosoma endophyticum]|uniref:Uncharacterized protein n=1 Tax=Spirosoma endophyticum TaxID=662367 RepID=A0A1I2IH09_9BACT|nr:hypothetical protein [Spirosoma endophyticum]SFF39821.1 hypothetical protein SAMN05216167_1665 [Spirosoma endophyticum]